ncbi:MAG: RraA family protein [Cyclobacteriaceae bacterium]|nr:RraA family protein [Cyclobacteriaceae bacterium]
MELKTTLLLILSIPYSLWAQPLELSDGQILEMYEGLRVADVSDGLDMVGLRDAGLMNTNIEALWKNTDDMSHIIRGIAITARYVPTNRVIKNPMEKEEFQQWEGQWYSDLSSEPYVEFIVPGSIIVLDVQGDGDTGSVGSYNSLDWYSRGARGVISNGGIRDTDEIIKQKIPVYLDINNRGRGIRPGRNEIESVNKPITVGGVLINPGDVIVADGDGVAVVPRIHAQLVAEYAKEILNKDKSGRRSLYEKLNMPLDKTVEIDQ